MFRLSLYRKGILCGTLQIQIQLGKMRRTYLLNIQNSVEKFVERLTLLFWVKWLRVQERFV